MKRGISRSRPAALLLATLLVFALALPALADSIWEPYADDFYQKHYDECTLMDRNFYLNGKDGYVTVYRSPEDKTVLDRFYNGGSVYVSFTYGQGQWGVVCYTAENGVPANAWNDKGRSGWVDMSDLLAIYDNIAFTAEHSGEFRQLETPKTLDLTAYGRVPVWNYPGAPTPATYIDIDQWNWELADRRASFHTLWTDQAGNEWGYLAYLYGIRGWICLSAPETEELPVLAVTYDLIPAAATLPSGGSGGFPTVVVLVAALAAVTLGIILFCFKKRAS